MLLAGKFSRPVAGKLEVHRRVLEPLLSGPAAVIQAPPGFLLTESLAAVLEARGAPSLWVRLGSEDADPVVCLHTLAHAVQELDPAAGQETLHALTATPPLPPLTLPSLYYRLGQALGQSAVHPRVVVCEQLHHLLGARATLRLLYEEFIGRLPGPPALIATAHDRRLGRLSAFASQQATPEELRTSQAGAAELLAQAGVALPTGVLRQALSLLDGQAVPLAGLGAAGQEFGASALQEWLRQARSGEALLERLAQAYLVAAVPAELVELSGLAYLGYTQGSPARAAPVNGPWTQALNHDWLRPYTLWRPVLKRLLHARLAGDTQGLIATAEELCEQGNFLDGLHLLFEIQAFESAAGCLQQQAAQLLGGGLWDTLQYYLERLPAALLDSHPRLLQAGGEMHLLANAREAALAAFERAVERFTELDDPAGAAASRLAVSALALHQADRGRAWAEAHKACSLAQSAGQPVGAAWAEFQIGWLAAQEDDALSALNRFGRAAELAQRAGKPVMSGYFQQMAALAAEQHRRQIQRQAAERMNLTAVQQELEGAQQFQQAIQRLPEQAAGLLAASDWLDAPLILKPLLPAPGQRFRRHNRRRTLWRRFLRWVSPEAAGVPAPPADATAAAQPDEPHPPKRLEAMSLPDPPPIALAPETTPEPPPETPQPSVPEPAPPSLPPPAAQPASPALPLTPPWLVTPPPIATLTAHLLGGFVLSLEDSPIARLPTGRSGSLLKYLVFHHQRRLPREALMDRFWPDVGADLARNRLNVALSSIRHALRSASPREVILFEDSKYFINPDLTIWLDVEEIERNLEAARRLRTAGQLAAAIQHLEVAANLYQGDFLSDDPYEEWTIPVRERLRLAYLDTLFRLGRDYFEHGQYAACAQMCQAILERDNCREDVHSLLMRCYAQQNQYYLALRQYHRCATALRQELDVQPAEATTALYEQLRRREPSKPASST